MLDSLKNLLFSDGYMPHGHCYLWQTPLVSLYVTSDLLIALAYFSIPAMLVYFVSQRKDVPFSQVFVLFGTFIVLCGLGHLLDIWTVWHPAYWVVGLERALTALISCYTALQMVTLLPQILALKTPEQLEAVNQELQEQIAERQRTEEILQAIVMGTSSVTGDAFFPALAENLASALGVAYVMVGEVADESLQRLRSLALWAGDRLIHEPVEYDLTDTPCKTALEAGSLCNYPSRLQQLFPSMRVPEDLSVESYVGVPLVDDQKNPIGHLCILDTKPFQVNDRTEILFQVFAARAATELQRKWAEDEKRRAYEELEFRVQERTTELVTANKALESEIQERLQIEAMLRDAVQREQAARALVEASEKRFRLLTETIPQHVWTALPDGRLTYANQRVYDYFGCPGEQILGLGWQQLVHPDDLASCFECWEHATATNTQFEAEFRLLRGADQIYRWHIARALPICNDGTLISWFGTSTDIDDQKRVEAEQRQQMRLSALRADVGTALTEGETLRDMLQRCAVALNEHLSAAFARIWTLDPTERVLVLQASAGMYTHIDGGHARVPVGMYKIGWIAEHRQPHLTNHVTTDPRVSDKEWAIREGMVSFAGYPLLIKDRLLGVMAIFARYPLTERVLAEMESVASAIAIGIDRKLTEAALRQTATREQAAARMLRQMRATLNLETIFQTTTEELRQVVQCDRVLVYRFNHDWSGELVYESVAEGWQILIPPNPAQSKLMQNATDQADCVIKVMTGEELAIQDTYLQETQGGAYAQSGNYRCVADIYAAGFDACYLELLELLQARAYIIVPIFLGKNLWGLLAVYQNSGPRQWETSEIKIVTQTASQLGVAVQQAELLAQTKQQAEELQLAKDAADRANRAKSEFLANMSHELRTPLNAILGFTQLMNKDSSLSPEHQQYIGIINRSGEHLLNLINDILEMSKIEAGRNSLHESDFDLYALLENLEEMFRLRASSRHLMLRFDRAADVPQYIHTDEGKLRQVLINLLGNAIKFTKQGHVILRVTIASGVQEALSGVQDKFVLPPAPPHPQPPSLNPQITLHFEVEDTGPGIAADEMHRLFEAFSQTRTGIRASEGTGLGLPISQTFVRLMGGEIMVASQVGRGSVFSFDVQVALAEVTAVVTSRSDRLRVVGLAPGQPTYRILVAEDIATNRLLLMKLLCPLGFAVQEAIDGKVALDIWQQWQPHLILMDMHMPVLNGYEATYQIKASPAGKNTIVIALTASAFEEQRQVILAAGCDDFIRKPFQEAELLEKLSQHLNITYLYDEAAVPTLESGQVSNAEDTSQAAADNALALAQLRTMPDAWVDELSHAAAQCSDVSVLRLLEQVPTDRSHLVEKLRDLANNFRFDQIHSLVQQKTN